MGFILYVDYAPATHLCAFSLCLLHAFAVCALEPVVDAACRLADGRTAGKCAALKHNAPNTVGLVGHNADVLGGF
jgi:hypothetical protein